MQSFTFKCPTEIVFGKGAEEQVPEKLRYQPWSRAISAISTSPE